MSSCITWSLLHKGICVFSFFLAAELADVTWHSSALWHVGLPLSPTPTSLLSSLWLEFTHRTSCPLPQFKLNTQGQGVKIRRCLRFAKSSQDSHWFTNALAGGILSQVRASQVKGWTLGDALSNWVPFTLHPFKSEVVGGHSCPRELPRWC